jgi:uncharacterized protein YjbI with pentapeptide repeats
MAATIKASMKGLSIVDKARCKKGWAKTDQGWADRAHVSKSTLRRFWSGIAIQSSAFQLICECVGVDDWTLIVDFEATDASDIEGKPTLERNKKHYILELNADFETIDPQKLHDVVAQLFQMGVVKRFVDVDEGSIKLLFEGSQEDYEQIETLFNSGELTELLDIPVESIHAVEKAELVRWIGKNGGAELQFSDTKLSDADLSKANLSYASLSCANLFSANLSDANLFSADLSGADLSGANLSGADLRRSDLSGANLSGANLLGARLFSSDLSRARLSRSDLSGADLSRSDLSRASLIGANLCGASLISAKLSRADLSYANLSGANLSHANLSHAELSGAKLSRANLSYVNLCGANLSYVNLSYANLFGASLRGANLRGANVDTAFFGSGIGFFDEQKQDLIERGAIFDDVSIDRESSLVSAPSGRR